MKTKTDGLTPRELEITQYLACGLSHKEIAGCLQRSVSTVSNTLRVLYEKLQLNKESEVVAYYLCKYHGASVSFDKVGKIRKALGAMVCLLLISVQIATSNNDNMIRVRRVSRGRRNEIEYTI